MYRKIINKNLSRLWHFLNRPIRWFTRYINIVYTVLYICRDMYQYIININITINFFRIYFPENINFNNVFLYVYIYTCVCIAYMCKYNYLFEKI